MSSKIYNCSLCLYNTTKKFNFNRHMVSKHTNNDIKNVIVEGKNVMVDNKCTKCGKILSSKKYLQKHLIICKGVSNPLECHLCHKILANRGSKSHHLKKCKGNLSSELTSKISSTLSSKLTNEIISTINNSNVNIDNSINNNNNNNSNNTLNNTANITNIIVFDPLNTNGTTLKTDHINMEFINKILKSTEQDAVSLYTKKIFDNPENRFIKKTNMRSMFSEIHTGGNNWDTCYDKDIYPKIISEICNCLAELITSKISNRRILNKIIEYVDYMSENGYCNNAEIKDVIKSQYKALLQRTKVIIYNISKKTILSE